MILDFPWKVALLHELSEKFFTSVGIGRPGNILINRPLYFLFRTFNPMVVGSCGSDYEVQYLAAINSQSLRGSVDLVRAM